MSEKINILREQLVDILADIEASVDYPEEDIDTADRDRPDRREPQRRHRQRRRFPLPARVALHHRPDAACERRGVFAVRDM